MYPNENIERKVLVLEGPYNYEIFLCKYNLNIVWIYFLIILLGMGRKRLMEARRGGDTAVLMRPWCGWRDTLIFTKWRPRRTSAGRDTITGALAKRYRVLIIQIHKLFQVIEIKEYLCTHVQPIRQMWRLQVTILMMVYFPI